MLVAFSCYAGNLSLAVHTLAHAFKLDGRVDYEFLLVHCENVDPAPVAEILGQYAKAFTAVKYEPATGWPLGKNFAWQSAARWMFEKRRNTPWLWLEPDAVPLKKGWLDDIKAEYAGAILACRNNSGFFDGVAVYPGDVLERSISAMLCRSAPFDQVAGKEFGPFITHSKTIKSVWDINGIPPSFQSRESALRFTAGASLFHRCKDGSLADCLNETLLDRVSNGLKKMMAAPSQKRELCVVALGRYGDIVNVLPVCRELAMRGEAPALMVAEQFKDVLDGVGYVEPEVFAGSFTDVKEAVRLAQSKYDRVLVGQVNSRNVGVNTECNSFSEEAWRQMGFREEYGRLPLVFDRRDSEREEQLVKTHRKTAKPLLLVNCAGKSSPFQAAPLLLNHLSKKWGETFEVLDLSTVKAHRVYDLLALMDVAACLITIDTATLHLAAGSHVPMIALLSETPTLWHGSKPKPETLLARRYSEVPERLHEIDAVLEKLSKGQSATPRFISQTKWECGQIGLPLNVDVSHFNPGICRDGSGKLWMVARKSKRNAKGRFDSTLLACRMSESMQVLETRDVIIPERKLAYRQHEDPRVIWKNNRFYVTFCGWNRSPRFSAPRQIVSVFSSDWRYEAHYQPMYGNNMHGSSGMEKNWALFGHRGRFHFIYSFQPHVVVEMVEGTMCAPHTSEHSLKWDYGQIRGGTPPVLIGGEYLTFFHSSQPWRNGQRRYYMGAYTFEAAAPFRVKRITKEPLLSGSENDTRIHGGPPVIFPCGALFENGQWLVTFGVNDEACGWIRIPMNDLEERLCI